ncbi:hypothetical protein ACIKTA_08740, partial [Hansschlegelia beijingensis]
MGAVAVCAIAGMAATAFAAAQTRARSDAAQPQPAISVETVADGLERPWGLAFLPGGRMLVTHRLTTTAGAPVPDNQNSWTAGPRG